MSVHGGISHRSSEACLRPSGSHFTLSVRVLSGQAKVEHVDFATIGGQATHRKVARLDVTMQEADGMDVLNGNEYLLAQPERGAEREALFALSASKLGQILSLQTHDHVVVILSSATANESANVVLALQTTQNGDLHLQYLFGLFGRLELESHMLLGDEIERLVNLTEASTTDFAQLEDEKRKRERALLKTS